MRCMKIKGGLTHGKGITDSVLYVLAKWILTMPIKTSLNRCVQKFCNVLFTTSEQHVDARPSIIKRDTEDVEKIIKLLSTYEPFIKCNAIMSITSGLKGDKTINCHNAFEVGCDLMQSIVELSFNELKFQRKNRILSLENTSSIEVKNEKNLSKSDVNISKNRCSIGRYK